ncbi:hypothetical protein [Microcella alkalica]|uniref:hypothetical protein n=1 Tax=Microcella alkalica TaxID=355930 RepID=UPI00145CA650|nr:hypothetical protein [Microcella alkalica]
MADKNELPLPGDAEKKKREITLTRLALWLIIGGFGAYLLISGLVGIVGKG